MREGARRGGISQQEHTHTTRVSEERGRETAARWRYMVGSKCTCGCQTCKCEKHKKNVSAEFDMFRNTNAKPQAQVTVCLRLAPTEVRCEFLKSSFFVVAVFLWPNRVISPTHKRTEGRAPVWGSELTSKRRRTTGGSPVETAVG